MEEERCSFIVQQVREALGDRREGGVKVVERLFILSQCLSPGSVLAEPAAALYRHYISTNSLSLFIISQRTAPHNVLRSTPTFLSYYSLSWLRSVIQFIFSSSSARSICILKKLLSQR